MSASRLDCSTSALTTPQKSLPIWKLVELKVLDLCDHRRTGISILTSAADLFVHPLFRPIPAFHFLETVGRVLSYPTNPFTILELLHPSHDVSELHKIRRSPDLEALQLWKSTSGSAVLSFLFCSICLTIWFRQRHFTQWHCLIPSPIPFA